MNQELADRIRRCEGLPTIPGVAVEILRIASDRKSDAAKVARVVSVDPALTARILRTVNSSHYGLGQQVTNLEQAIALLGMRTVKVLILGFSLSDHLIGGASGRLDLSAYWRRSVYSAAAARDLCKAVEAPRADACFLSAMLMDVGMVALDQVLGGEYARIVEAAPNHRALARAEQEALGMTHADASAILAEHWRLPPLVRDPMAAHHQPHGAGAADRADAAGILWLAGRCADVFLEPEPMQALTEVRRECAERYGVGEARCDEMLCGVGRAGVELAALLEVRPPQAPVPRHGVAAYGRRSTDHLPGQQNGAKEAEKRHAPRTARQGSLPIIPFTGGGRGGGAGPVRVSFRDLSRNGIGLTCARAMALGSQFLLHLRRQDGDAVPIICTVVRCAPGRAGFDIGARITAVHRP